jgi:peptide/nickel transport system substrate-binding protein
VFIKNELQQIGIPLKIDVHPGGFLRQLRNESKVNFFRGSWIADYPDPENFLNCFYSDNFSPSGPNFFHYSNKSFDSLFRAASVETDPAKRNDLLALADSCMLESSPVVVLFYDKSIRLTQKNVHGLTSNPANYLRLRAVRKR